ncbi:hypothetical protein AWV80_37010 [Cupriavidus sp. UYMU48A]|nr:hypothetical protein AWV80_37010 [Cupriavidus sp. UYMU48A]
MYRGSGAGLKLGQFRRDKTSKGALVEDDQSMLIQPLAGIRQQSFPISATRYFVAQRPHKGRALVCHHPAKSERLAS